MSHTTRKHQLHTKANPFSFATEAEAATDANVYAVVVDRPGNAPLSDASKATFPVIEKLTDLP